MGESVVGCRAEHSRFIEKKMKILIALSYLFVVHGAPQYGGGVSHPVKAPAPVQSSPLCRTEYAVVWDTEYVETEHRSAGLYRSSSAAQSTRRSACPSRGRSARLCTMQCATHSMKRCAARSTEMRQSTTQRLTAVLTTSRTVSTNGRGRGTTRCGRLSMGPARTMLTTSARMCRRRG